MECPYCPNQLIVTDRLALMAPRDPEEGVAWDTMGRVQREARCPGGKYHLPVVFTWEENPFIVEVRS